MTTGQKMFSLKDKHDGKTPDDIRLAKDKARPVIKATRKEGGSKGKSRKAQAKITKGVTDKK